MKTTKTLENLFLDELADMYDAEQHLVEALPKMVESATHEDLRAAFEHHLEETHGHVTKVEAVFEAFGKPAKTKKCAAIRGLIKEAESIISENKNTPVINAALISAGQKVEHYEIASYGCLREWAEQLENEDAVQLLSEILKDEKVADNTLTVLAREHCNITASEQVVVG